MVCPNHQRQTHADILFLKKTHVVADSEISGTTGKGIVEEAAALEAALV